MFFDEWEQLSQPTIRPATPSDVRTIARLHVDGWKSTYRGILPDEVLEGLQYADRERTWMRLVAGGDSGPYVLVAEIPGEGIAGFVAAGPERSDMQSYSSEVYAIYVAEEHQGNGIGRSFLQYVAQIMSENAQQGLLLWTFTQSPSNDFFRRLGAQDVSTRSRPVGETPVEETAFGWPDIRRLLEESAPVEDEEHEEPGEEEHEEPRESDERDAQESGNEPN